MEIEMPDRVSDDQIAEWHSYLKWLRDPYTCNVTTGSAETLAAVLAELNAERARSAEARMRMDCEFDCGNCNVCRLRATIHVIQGRLKQCRQTGREAQRWASWFAAERDYLRGEVAKDYAAIAEKQRRDNTRVAAADIRAAELLARITELENQVGVLEGLMPDD
jgi:hypothetical protein